MEWTPIVDMAYDCSISLGTATTTCVATIQLKDYAGNDLDVRGVVDCYISSDDNGDEVSTVTSIVIATDGDILTIESTKAYKLISEDDGDIGLTIDGTGANSRYLNVVLPNGKIVTSSVITFTA